MKIKKYVIKYQNRTYEYSNKKQYERDLKLFNNCETYEYEASITQLIEITLINNKGEEFQKGFDSIKDAQLFINKVKRGNKLTITLIQSWHPAVLKEIYL